MEQKNKASRCCRFRAVIRNLYVLFVTTLTTNTYSGYRSDLRVYYDDDDSGPMDREDIKKTILILADQHRLGTCAYEVANYCGVSKEWARKLMKRMEKEGILRLRQFGQFKIYYKNE